jgi:DNA-directed RNA polymerase subunit RPC12/RpoP
METDASALVSGWWHDNELAACPHCGNKRLTPPSPSMDGLRVCLTCGVIEEPDAS